MAAPADATDSWEDDDWETKEPVLPLKAQPIEEPKPASQWDGEDAEDEEEKEKDTDKPKTSKPKPAKKEKAAAIQDERLADPVAEKLRQQRLVEEADLQNAKEVFGTNMPEVSLDGFVPRTEAEYLQYGELVGAKILPFDRSAHYPAMLKTILALATKNLKSEEVKAISTSLSVIANEKLKAEKAAQGGGKKKTAAAKKKTLNVDTFEDDRYGGDYSNDPDDYDFM